MVKDRIIIGDNEKVLKSGLLSEDIGKIKIIYIDPPYNTQTVKSYKDNITSKSWAEYIKIIVSELYKYLSDAGALFISIDDAEYAALKIICDDVFKKTNFVGTFITRQSQRSNSKHINTVHEYVLCYAKNKQKLSNFSVKRIDIPEQKDMILNILKTVKHVFDVDGQHQAEKKLVELIKENCNKYNITWLKNYNCVDCEGNVYFASDLSVPSKPRIVNIPSINLTLDALKTRGWVSDKKFIELFNKGLLVFKDNRPYCKKYLIDATDNAPSLLNFYSRQGTNNLNKLGLRDLFDTPKPVELIKFLIRLLNPQSSDIVMDVFGGSGTTAQAVIEVNKEDKKDIHYILVQKAEQVDSGTKIYKSCLRYGIEPYVSEILKLRVKTVMNLYSISLDTLSIENYV